jgi:NADH-quinone oxidoreductase subunit C
MTADAAKALIESEFGVAVTVTGAVVGVSVVADQWRALAEAARHRLGCGFFNFSTAVDLKDDGLEVVARLDNLDDRFALLMKTRLGPGISACPSLVPVYRGADWMERETYDMFGVVFEGHPDLRRILLPDDWQGFPLLKSYAVDTPYPPYR